MLERTRGERARREETRECRLATDTRTGAGRTAGLRMPRTRQLRLPNTCDAEAIKCVRDGHAEAEADADADAEADESAARHKF